MSSNEVANLFASKFIARKDVKAVQFTNGAWSPHQQYNEASGRHDGPRIPWRRADLEAHIGGRGTFGHYLLDPDSRCKLFAFDVDLNKAGSLPTRPFFSEDAEPEFAPEADLRAAWLNRAHPARDYMKLQFKTIANRLLETIFNELGIPCAAAYSGAKGIHVYGFFGKLIPADEAREGAKIVLDEMGGFSPLRGEHFFKHEDYENLSVEVFPKQNSLDGKDLGNLMRLPLGKNLKAPKEPTFFIDMTAPIAELRPADPIKTLTTGNPWE